MNTENQKPKKSDAEDQTSDDSRSPGVTDRSPNTSENTSKNNEAKEPEQESKTKKN